MDAQTPPLAIAEALIARARAEGRSVLSEAEGKALAGTLGTCNCVLMRGHGMTVIGDSVPEAVFRAIYTEMNARLQLQATQLEGPIEFLSDEEGRRSQAANRSTLERPWELWKKKALAGK